ncbi:MULTISPECIES: hypothetical protein [Streptomyces]|uniref:Uncharacterized protein n=1 Tax=Streptomyces virginiae TaxID=1961 RepID=A0A0L8MFC4_STRVG|nr:MULTISPECIES: hypothetical protein [Streptomyces]KOG49077.1 hypothetical protein ADK75_19820 [Streptomyces virginiae]
MTDEAGETRAEEPAEPAEPAAPEEPAGPVALGVVRTPTGHAGVDAHLARLADADHLAADGHVEVYEDVHRGLREALTALDAPPVPGPYENRS